MDLSEELKEYENVERVRIYHYDRKTKVLISSNEVVKDPYLGIALVPAFATLEEPPLEVGGKCAVFNQDTNTWNLVEDNRGYYYNTKENVGSRVFNADPLVAPKDCTTVAPPELPDSDHHYIWDDETNQFLVEPYAKKVSIMLGDQEVEVEEHALLTAQLPLEEKLFKLGITLGELRQGLGL